jgi:hypothetical protein
MLLRMDKLLRAILDDDRDAVSQLLESDSKLVSRGVDVARFYDYKIFHWLYVRDTALHLADAGYRVAIIRLLLAAGADPNAALNHRHASPLHYAADGYVTGPAWDPLRQCESVECLLSAGADIDLQDKNGASPLHRAVRTRCSAAVRALLDAGADSTLRNKSGSTPFHLAVQNTGRGGTGMEKARAEQQKIIEEFLRLGISSSLQDGNGKSVLEWAKPQWIRSLLVGKERDRNAPEPIRKGRHT